MGLNAKGVEIILAFPLYHFFRVAIGGENNPNAVFLAKLDLLYLELVFVLSRQLCSDSGRIAANYLAVDLDLGRNNRRDGFEVDLKFL